jgi:PAS domain S-box-containing protein
MFALLLVGVFSLVNYVLMRQQLQQTRNNVAFLDASNHQETLMLKTAWKAQGLIDLPPGPQRELARASLRQLAHEIESTHKQVLKPDIDLARSTSLNDQTGALVAHSRALANTPDNSLNAVNPDYQAIRASVSDSALLGELHLLTTEYEAHRSADGRRLLHLAVWDLSATFGVLAATAWLVFRPMKRRIQSQIQELQEAEAYNRAIVETAADGILTIDTEGRITSVNPAAEITFGSSRDMMVNQQASRFLPWTAREAMATGRIAEVEGTRHDGNRFPMEMAVSDMTPGNQPVHVVVARDVTERKRLEQAMLQSERLAVVGTMSAKVAHEIRNPLGSITLNLDLVRKEIQRLAATSQHSSSEGQTLLDEIRDEVRRIQRVIEDYLRFARMPKLARKTTPLNDFLEQKLAFMGATFEQARVQCLTEFSPAVTTVKADTEQLWQALLNLIRNALEAMPDGGKLVIATRLETGEVAIRISDTGKGMSDEQMRRLFEPFSSTKAQGTGLGLAMAQQIAMDHGGRIECTSEVDKGSTFTVYVPCMEPT